MDAVSDMKYEDVKETVIETEHGFAYVAGRKMGGKLALETFKSRTVADLYRLFSEVQRTAGKFLDVAQPSTEQFYVTDDQGNVTPGDPEAVFSGCEDQLEAALEALYLMFQHHCLECGAPKDGVKLP